MYRTFDCSFWDDPKFEGDHRDVMWVAGYLFTNPQSHVSGLYILRIPQACEHLRMTRARFDECFQILCQKGFCKWDAQRRVVWVVNMFKRQPHSGQLLKGVANHLVTLFESPLIGEFLARYSDFVIPYQYPIDTISLQEQEQEQEQKTELREESCTQEGAAPPLTRKPAVIRDPERLRQELAKIDLAAFHQDFPDIDVDSIYESFCDRVIGARNPKDYHNFTLAFRNWCRPKQKEVEAKKRGGRVSVEIERDRLRKLRETQGEAN